MTKEQSNQAQNPAPTIEEQVSSLVGKLEKNDDGKWEMPEDVIKEHDVSDAMLYAIKTEKRRRVDQAAYTQTRQQLAKEKAVSEELSNKFLSIASPLSEDQKEELADLKVSDPDQWRVKLNEYETAAKEARRQTLEETRQAGAQKGELEMRQEAIAEFAQSTGIELTDEIITREVPPKYVAQLEAGEITFDDFLQTAKVYVAGEKVIAGANDKPKNEPDIGDMPGGNRPQDPSSAQEDVAYESQIF